MPTRTLDRAQLPDSQTFNRQKKLIDEFLIGDHLPSKAENLYPIDEQSCACKVTLKKIPFCSMCEHHLVPFFGHIDLCYLPKNQLLGLSRFSSLIAQLSRRLTLQEKLGSEIAHFFFELLEPRAILIEILAYHSCSAMKHPDRPHTPLITSHFLGDPTEHDKLVHELVRAHD